MRVKQMPTVATAGVIGLLAFVRDWPYREVSKSPCLLLTFDAAQVLATDKDFLEAMRSSHL